MVSYDMTKTPVVNVVDDILAYAATHGASDIHFDPRDDFLMVRMRVDGDLNDYTKIQKIYERNLITRIKLLANMNITESRLPQDGSIKGTIKGIAMETRVSTLPTNEGEKCVIRILDYSRSLAGIDSLGFNERNLKKLKKMIKEPNGIILITGATGSGKSTTVYSILQVLNNKEIVKIVNFDDNKGAGIAYNKGIELCTNKWASIMDSDDFADPTKFEKQMKYLSNHEDVDVIGSNAVEFMNIISNVVSTRIMPETNEEIISFGHGRCPIIQPTAIFKVEAVRNAGSYQHSPLTEDYDLYIRMIMNGCKFYTYQEMLYYIRTSKDFYKRRGGIKYLKPILGFKYKYYKKGFFTTKQFIKTFMSSLIVSLMPNKIRAIIYKKYLRN